jgi:hypothetical protein
VCECLNAVDIEEIKRLGKRFKKLDLDKSGSLSVDEFMSLPELQQNPLVQRVIDIFDTDGNGEVDFKGRDSIYGLFIRSICIALPTPCLLFLVIWISMLQPSVFA